MPRRDRNTQRRTRGQRRRERAKTAARALVLTPPRRPTNPRPVDLWGTPRPPSPREDQ